MDIIIIMADDAGEMVWLITVYPRVGLLDSGGSTVPGIFSLYAYQKSVLLFKKEKNKLV